MDEEMISRSSHRFRLCVHRGRESCPGCLCVINDATVINNNSGGSLGTVTGLAEGPRARRRARSFRCISGLSLSAARQGRSYSHFTDEETQPGRWDSPERKPRCEPWSEMPPAHSPHLTALPRGSPFPGSSVFNSWGPRPSWEPPALALPPGCAFTPPCRRLCLLHRLVPPSRREGGISPTARGPCRLLQQKQGDSSAWKGKGCQALSTRGTGVLPALPSVKQHCHRVGRLVLLGQPRRPRKSGTPPLNPAARHLFNVC